MPMRSFRSSGRRVRARSSCEGGSVAPSTEILFDTFAALCLGALVGLERQVAERESAGEKDFPGVRTFALTGLMGALSVLISRELGPFMGVALFVAVAGFLVLRYRYDVSQREDPGYTTEIASLCIFVVGALAQAGQLLVATVVTISILVLLRVKRTMRRVEGFLSAQDMESLIRFLVITGIVLPLLPDEPIDALYGVIRPRDVWRMVVLISGLSFTGFVLMRLDLGKRGVWITGLLGGIVSSTAATVAYARAAREAEDPRPFETMAALAASAPPLRMGLVIAFISPPLAAAVAAPLGALFALGVTLALLRDRTVEQGQPPSFENPLTLRLALSFAAIYALVLVLLAAVESEIGASGLYVTSALSALPGVDAPTLSLARLSADGRVSLEVARAAVLGVAAASAAAKCGLLLSVGRGSIGPRVATSLGAVAAAGLAAACLLS